jgi:hypothetical protein
MQSLCSQVIHSLSLETKLRVTGVKLKALVDGDVFGHDGGCAGCGRTVQTAVFRNDIVLGKALGDVAVDTVAKKQVGASTSVTSEFALASSCKQLGLERLGVLAKTSNILSHKDSHHTGVVGGGHRSTGEEVDDVVASAPGAKDLLTRAVDVDALADVENVETLLSMLTEPTVTTSELAPPR